MKEFRPLQGKTALITGASSGIGEACAGLLAKRGMNLILTGRNLAKLTELERDIAQYDVKTLVIVADLTVREQRQALFDQVMQTWGAPDVLFNNAGLGWYGYFAEMDEETAVTMLNINDEALVHLSRLFLPPMLARRSGQIINTSSIAGGLHAQGIAVYGASKAFIDSFSIALNRELKGSGVCCSVLRPGPIKTAFFRRAESQTSAQQFPLQAFAVSAERVAEAVYSLIRWPRAVKYVPGYYRWLLRLYFLYKWILDLGGPLLLKSKKYTRK